MDTRLVSKDRDLFEFCWEVLSEIPEHTCTLSAVPLERASTGADLYIWDFHPEFPLPDWVIKSLSHHLFLMDLSNRSDFPAGGVPAGPMIR